MNLQLERETARWYALKPHPVQNKLVNDSTRFKLVPAGRRSGKTERAKRYLAKIALSEPNEVYFAGAPTRAQAKKIWWKDLKALTFSSVHPKKPSETELIIYLPNNTEVHVVGLDEPARIEGQLWSGGVIDEIADIKRNAWAVNIAPALDTFNPQRPDYLAWCWLIGVPDGLGEYYDLCEYAKNSGDEQWKLYTWFSSDILPQKTIDAAKRRMSAKQFRQEFEGSFETAAGKIYEDYSKDNYTDETIESHEQLCWYHDFNYTPMSNGIGVIRDDKILLLDEIILSSAVAKQSALEFVIKFVDHDNKHVLIYGDPAGRAGEKHGHVSDFIAMEEVLKANGWTFERRVKKKHPSIKDRQNAVRAKIRSASNEISLYVNKKNAPYTHKGLATTQLKEGSTFQEADSDYQHITTAIGYFIDYEWPIDNIFTGNIKR